jgi:hypothetical protein
MKVNNKKRVAKTVDLSTPPHPQSRKQKTAAQDKRSGRAYMAQQQR